MSIFEYDQEKHMRQEREEAWEEGKKAGIAAGKEVGKEEGREEGKKAGIAQGKRELLCELIQNNRQRGKSAVEIAEGLGLPKEVIEEILQDLDGSLSE